jgi:hypothetical protein
MKRLFNPIKELRSRFPERFTPKWFVPSPSMLLSRETSSLAVFSITFAVLAFVLMVSPDTYATPSFDSIKTALTTLVTDLSAVLTELLKAIITIGIAAAAVFIAANIMKWLRVIA